MDTHAWKTESLDFHGCLECGRTWTSPHANAELTGNVGGDTELPALWVSTIACGSPYWNGVQQGGGAATWANGNNGLVDVVSPANSLVGSSSFDYVGANITALTNGHYVVDSAQWNSPSAVDVGAVTWGNGNTGVVGTPSATPTCRRPSTS